MDDETSFDSTISNNDNTLDIEYNEHLEPTESNKHLLSLQKQEQLIEQLKHEKLLLEEWKTEIGLVAVETVETLTSQIEIIQNTSQQYQLEIEGLQTKNNALNQQIQAYQDEIDKLHKEKPKMESQIVHFEQLLNEQYMITSSLSTKDKELSDLKNEYDSNKLLLENSYLELKTLRKENDEIRGENEQYLLLLDKYREQEIKLKKQANDNQLEIQELTQKYNKLHTESQQETNETREQLQVARHIANNLSDQLEEIHNFQNSPCNSPHDIESNKNCNINGHKDNILPFGRPLFEKRKTLKILTIEKSLKLPNMSDDIEPILNGHGGGGGGQQSDDEFIDFHASKSPQPPMMKIIINNNTNNNNNNKYSSPLPPVNEFIDDELNEGGGAGYIEHIDDEKQLRLPIIVGNVSFDDDQKERLLAKEPTEQRQRSSSSNSNSSISNTFDDSNIIPYDIDNNMHNKPFLHNINSQRICNDDEEEIEEEEEEEYIYNQEEDEQIERLLRKVSGSSYYKFRNGNNMKCINFDIETKKKLKKEIIKYCRNIKVECATNSNKEIEEREVLIAKYKLDAKEWEDKYNKLRRYNKRIKLKQQQKKQKSKEGVIGGCKFWSWSLSKNYLNTEKKPIINNDEEEESLNADNKINCIKKVRFAVPEDSD